MRRALFVATLISLFALPAVTQEQTTDAKTEAKEPLKAPEGEQHFGQLTDTYAKAALLALRAIEGDGTEPEIIKGEVYINRHTSDAINAADIEATTEQEKSVTALLNRVYSKKLTNNLCRGILQIKHEGKFLTLTKDRRALAAQESMAKDPIAVQMKERENACFGALDTMLRARKYERCQACDKIESDEKPR